MNKQRASKACKRCHQLRVRCDASTNTMPCTRCKQDRATNCELIVSRRGRYSRKKSNSKPLEEEVSTTVAASSSTDFISPQASDDMPLSSGGLVISSSDNSSTSPEERSIAIASHTIDGEAATWSSVLDQVLYKLRDPKAIITTSSITYLGESFLLSHLLEDDFREGGKLRLHHAGPTITNAFSPRSGSVDKMMNFPQDWAADELELLRSRGVFVKCEPKIEEAFIASFFELFYPIYPIVNKQDFLQQYHDNEIPWILLHAVCFASSTFCSLSLIHAAGFNNRSDARNVFYNRAKLLFDHNYEKNKLVIVQIGIMLSFHVGNPNELWYSHFWIGVAVSVAETLGMHRSITATSLSQKDKSLFKRLWWVLVIRDSFIGSFFGHPLRINAAQCDVEMLTYEDLKDDANNLVQCAYQIEISKLAVILRDIVQYRWNPRNIESEHLSLNLASLDSRIVQWRASIPAILDWHHEITPENEIFSLALAMIYNHHLIYIHLPRSSQGHFTSLAEKNSSYDKLDNAVSNIIKYASALVKSSKIRSITHESFSSLFAAEIILCSQLKHSDRILADLARAKLDLCQMILNQVVDFWDSSSWVSHLINGLVTKIERELEAGQSRDLPDQLELPMTRTGDDASSGMNVCDDNMSEVLSFMDSFQRSQAFPITEQTDVDLLLQSFGNV